MEGGLVFYNSFLPEIAPKHYHGRVSAWGYMVGYAGSIISLVMALLLIRAGSITSVWTMVACFFAIFSLPVFFFLPGDTGSGASFMSAGKEGIAHTFRTIRDIWRVKASRKFLLAFLIYEDGVNTVIVFSSIFAATTLGFISQELIFLYLIVQTTAFAGSLVMAGPIDFWGPKKVVILSLILWASVAVIAFFIQSKIHFWALASCAGLGLGTVQAASRAFYVQFIPQGKEAEYFGVYSLVGKSSAIFGPLLFGYVSSSFGNQRPAILSVAVFFLAGLIILSGVKGGGPNVRKNSSVRGMV
jgi:UMF1 family MFS transporter